LDFKGRTKYIKKKCVSLLRYLKSRMTGIVYKSTGSWYSIKSLEGDFYECRIKGKFRIQGIKSTNPLAVGDRVDFDLETVTIPKQGSSQQFIRAPTTSFGNRSTFLSKPTSLRVILTKCFC